MFNIFTLEQFKQEICRFREAMGLKTNWEYSKKDIWTRDPIRPIDLAFKAIGYMYLNIEEKSIKKAFEIYDPALIEFNRRDLFSQLHPLGVKAPPCLV